MSDSTVELEELIGKAKGLSPLDKIRLVEEMMSSLQEELGEKKVAPRRSLYGILPDANISEEDISEARREMWGKSLREDDR